MKAFKRLSGGCDDRLGRKKIAKSRATSRASLVHGRNRGMATSRGWWDHRAGADRAGAVRRRATHKRSLPRNQWFPAPASRSRSASLDLTLRTNSSPKKTPGDGRRAFFYFLLANLSSSASNHRSQLLPVRTLVVSAPPAMPQILESPCRSR